MTSRMLLALALLGVACIALTRAQSINTVNGSIVMRFGSATMTLADSNAGSTPPTTTNSPYSPTLTQADFQAALASQIQPQISAISNRTDAQLGTTNAALALANTVQQSINGVQQSVTTTLTNMQTALLQELNATNARVNGQLNVSSQALVSANTLQQFLLALQVNFSSSLSQLQTQITTQLGTSTQALNVANTVQQSCNTAQLSFNASISQVQSALQSQITDLSSRVTTLGNTSSLQASFASMFDTIQRSFNTSLTLVQNSVNQQIASVGTQTSSVQNVSNAALAVATAALSSTTTLQNSLNTLQAQYNSLLQNYTVLQQFVQTLLISLNDVQSQVTNSITTTAGALSSSYANMYYSLPSGGLTVGDGSIFGAQMAFNRQFVSRSITVSPSTGTWTHAAVGTYVAIVTYRQSTGNDIWTVFAVTKDGPGQAVGVSARVGSENSRITIARIVYTVDSTTATYQLQQWCTSPKTVCGGSGCFGTNPSWSDVVPLTGGFPGDIGRWVDYVVYRLGDSETVSPTPLVNSPSTAAFASFYFMSTVAITVSSNAPNGLLMPFNRAGPSLRISLNTGTSTWTHALTGTYILFVSYRQDPIADTSTVFAVTKDGTSNAVGVSARTGSGSLGTINANHRLVYTVDSTTSTYQLQHWSSTAKTVGQAAFAGGPPQWAFYSSLCGGFTGDTGRLLDFLVYRLGDLDAAGGAGTTNNTAFANMYLIPTASPTTISDNNGGLGVLVPFNRAGPSQRIQLNLAQSTWTHSLLGTYQVSISFRQATGGDTWVVLGVTKNGNSNAVGVSSRVASDNGGNLEYRLVYTVDSTTAAYQLQQWSGVARTVCSGTTACWAASPAPGWTNYATLCGGDTGRAVDIFIQRLGN